MKIDLHVHSRFSKRPATWLLKKIGCAESYSEPERIYHICKAHGMDAVTITDHNSIEGCLEIAHYPDAFLGCEVTSYFPEDRCKIHVLTYMMTEDQYTEIDRLRENVLELVPYLVKQDIPHALAHPFHAVNDRMTPERFEQCLLLFDTFEINGDQDAATNDCLRRILEDLTPDDLERLAAVHGMIPLSQQPWNKRVIGGSDDHSSLNIGHTYTEVSGATTPGEYWQGVQAGAAEVRVPLPATPQTMAHGLYGVAYQMYQQRFDFERYQEYNILMRFLDRMLQTRERKAPSRVARLYSRWRHARSTPNDTTSLTKTLQHEAEKIVLRDPQLKAVLDQGLAHRREPHQHWYRFVNQITNRMLGHVSRHTLTRLSAGNPFDLFHALGSTGALYTLLAPYFAAYGIFCRDRRLAEETFAKTDGRQMLSDKPRVGHFTDTFEEINGVARTLNLYNNLAQSTGKDLTLITCAPEKSRGTYTPGVRYFEPVDLLSLPEYEEQKIFVPSLLEMLHYCYEKNFTHIHSATPGPIGLAGFVISRIMRIPFYTTYHTQIPQFAGHLTDDAGVENMAWCATIWFYQQADCIYSLSASTTEELVEKGIDPARIRRVPRGVNTDLFSPDKRREDLGLPEGTRFLYCGRVSKEKGLHVLARAFREVYDKAPGEARLVIAGDGPFLDEMRQRMRDLPVTFTGYVEGEQLSAVYASCDAFVFPSTTDTFGNVVLEAQASGLPTIVTNQGGPCENIVADETGLVVPGENAAALREAMLTLLGDQGRLKSMSQAARAYACSRSQEKAFEQYWSNYQASASPEPGENPLPELLASASA